MLYRLLAGVDSFHMSQYTLHYSDSLNISPRARWVVCPMGRTRGPGHCRRVQVHYPSGFENTEKKIPCSNGSFPAAHSR